MTPSHNPAWQETSKTTGKHPVPGLPQFDWLQLLKCRGDDWRQKGSGVRSCAAGRAWRRVAPILIVALGSMLAGCAAPPVNGPRFTQLEGISQPDTALIYFYRPGEESRNIQRRKFHVFIDGKETGILPYGGYFTRAVQPGKVVVTVDSTGTPIPLIAFAVAEMTKKPGRIEINPTAGSRVFIKLRATDEFWNIAGNLTTEDEATAVKELERTNHIE